MKSVYALIGWSLPVIESMKNSGLPYVVVSLPDFETYAKEHDIPFVSYQLEEWGDNVNSLDLYEKLKPFGATVAVPLYEETVEWAGALNSIFRNDPRALNRAFLFRNKAMMKRKALLAGLRVGVFEEVHNIEQVYKFQDRLNEANLQLAGEEDAWFHVKPFSAAGTVGHHFIKSREQIAEKLKPEDFPCMVESHLSGKEFSCEAFIHRGKVKFLNITEYVKLGFSNFIPAGPHLESKRNLIMKEIEKIVQAFGIEYGMIHPEFFLTEDDVLNFGEVACRIPGGHILELASKAYNKDMLLAFVVSHDPALTDEELAKFFPAEDENFKTYHGNVMVYPKGKTKIDKLELPETLLEDPYFIDHNLVPPIAGQKLSADRDGYGNHFGTVNFSGDDASRMRELLNHYQDVAFYQ